MVLSSLVASPLPSSLASPLPRASLSLLDRSTTSQTRVRGRAIFRIFWTRAARVPPRLLKLYLRSILKEFKFFHVCMSRSTGHLVRLFLVAALVVLQRFGLEPN